MKRTLCGLFLCVFSISVMAAPWAAKKPKLIVVIVIDQFRSDYLSRFQHLFSKSGFMALIRGGAYFPYAEYDVLQSMTAPGHATILTGAYPYQMGIPLNEWYDQQTSRVVYCVDDSETKTVGGAKEHPGASPKNLIGTTVGDEMKNAGWPGKVVSLALKDRAAVLLGGHRPDLAFWFDQQNAQWLTSSYYRKDGLLPAWLVQFNRSGSFSKCHQDEPCGATMTVDAFKAALSGERLGQGPGTDILAVSFSNHDFAGHRFGPNAEEMKVMTVAEDKAIADIRAAVQSKVPGGLKNVVFVLTGDHGIAPTPAYLAGTGIPSGNIHEDELIKEMDKALTEKFGKAKSGKWIAHVIDFNFFVDDKDITEAKADVRELENILKSVLMKNEAFAQVFTRVEYEEHRLPPEMFERKINRTYYRGRSGLVVGIQKPFYINAGKNEANHMTGYTYDRTVPIVLSGMGIKNGIFSNRVEVVDIAPTLAFLIGVLPPALSEGKVLSQALAPVDHSGP